MKKPQRAKLQRPMTCITISIVVVAINYYFEILPHQLSTLNQFASYMLFAVMPIMFAIFAFGGVLVKDSTVSFMFVLWVLLLIIVKCGFLN